MLLILPLSLPAYDSCIGLPTGIWSFCVGVPTGICSSLLLISLPIAMPRGSYRVIGMPHGSYSVIGILERVNSNELICIVIVTSSWRTLVFDWLMWLSNFKFKGLWWWWYRCLAAGRRWQLGWSALSVVLVSSCRILSATYIVAAADESTFSSAIIATLLWIVLFLGFSVCIVLFVASALCWRLSLFVSHFSYSISLSEPVSDLLELLCL